MSLVACVEQDRTIFEDGTDRFDLRSDFDLTYSTTVRLTHLTTQITVYGTESESARPPNRRYAAQRAGSGTLDPGPWSWPSTSVQAGRDTRHPSRERDRERDHARETERGEAAQLQPNPPTHIRYHRHHSSRRSHDCCEREQNRRMINNTILEEPPHSLRGSHGPARGGQASAGSRSGE